VRGFGKTISINGEVVGQERTNIFEAKTLIDQKEI
jgi:hypothetical protein